MFNDHVNSRVIHTIRRRGRWLKNQSQLILIEIKLLLGIPVRLRSQARAVLENIILPYYISNYKTSRVLFVGSDYYTKHYSRIFRKFEYWTIDPDLKKKRYGSKKHIVDSIEHINSYFGTEYFDIIICNGVLGHGLNDKESTEQAISNCFNCLSIGGTFVLGWNDMHQYQPFDFDELQSLHKFQTYEFPPLGTWNYLTTIPYRHVYSFFIKPDIKESGDKLYPFTLKDMKS